MFVALKANHNKDYSVVKTFRLLPIVLYRWAFFCVNISLLKTENVRNITKIRRIM
jgi:hypothetical protein